MSFSEVYLISVKEEREIEAVPPTIAKISNADFIELVQLSDGSKLSIIDCCCIDCEILQ